MIRYAITEAREQEAGNRGQGISLEYVQLRAKDVDGGELVRRAQRLVAEGYAKVLVNGRADVAVAAGAAGVHLTARSEELTVAQVRTVFAKAGRPEPLVSVSCHTLDEIARACEAGADLILFGPVFEKRVAGDVVLGGVGLEALRAACVAAGAVPVLALGGVSEENAVECLEAGAAGVAGIRLFGQT